MVTMRIVRDDDVPSEADLAAAAPSEAELFAAAPSEADLFAAVPSEADLVLSAAAAELEIAKQVTEAATDQARAAVRDAAAAGLSERSIADALGVTRAVVRRWLGKT